MIVTIDGPAGAGKSSVAKLLASRLGFQFLDTGAMYRAVTWAALENQVDHGADLELAKLASSLQIEFDDQLVFVNGRDVTDEIRSTRVTKAVSDIADNPSIRKHLVALQQQVASGGNFVCEGRDQGTIAFPNAICKIFLTASSAERARRRFEQLSNQGKCVDYEAILRDQQQRDQRDESRKIGRLMKADDAVEVASDGLSLQQVVDQIEKIVRARISALETR